MYRPAFHFALRVIFVGMIVTGRVVSAAPNKAKIQESIAKAHKYLLQQQLSGPHGSFAVLGLIKSGVDKKSEKVQKIVQEIVMKCQSDAYVPHQHCLQLLRIAFRPKAIKDKAHRENAQQHANYLIARDREIGLDVGVRQVNEVKGERHLHAEIGKPRTGGGEPCGDRGTRRKKESKSEDAVEGGEDQDLC